MCGAFPDLRDPAFDNSTMSRVVLTFLALCTLASCFVANQAGRVGAPLRLRRARLKTHPIRPAGAAARRKNCAPHICHQRTRAAADLRPPAAVSAPRAPLFLAAAASPCLPSLCIPRRLTCAAPPLRHPASSSFPSPATSSAALPSIAAPLKPLASRSAPTMMVEDAAAGAVAAVTTTIATTAGDFGGYTIPIVGLFLLAATISFLAGPLED